MKVKLDKFSSQENEGFVFINYLTFDLPQSNV